VLRTRLPSRSHRDQPRPSAELYQPLFYVEINLRRSDPLKAQRGASKALRASAQRKESMSKPKGGDCDTLSLCGSTTHSRVGRRPTAKRGPQPPRHVHKAQRRTTSSPQHDPRHIVDAQARCSLLREWAICVQDQARPAFRLCQLSPPCAAKLHSCCAWAAQICGAACGPRFASDHPTVATQLDREARCGHNGT